MSHIISFSADSDFAKDFDNLIERSGYKNRSRFIRDASLFFAEKQQRGELMEMDEATTVEGHLVVYYQHDHGKGQKLLDLRHSELVEVSSYSHSSLKHSHSCVDLLQIKGSAGNIRFVIEELQNTSHIDKVSFIVAPMRDDGCC
ncbi:MAG: ribbon-helix-helix protein, CopG family [Candidatus Thalassarchaeaceae archaeon]|jgi:metal-responsive CopG/Arc/MetJ family transcriptional regulator|nr:ribbon-helix-helix protein, CopG family [Candidatus Thalassarchaeaceae archaeon]